MTGFAEGAGATRPGDALREARTSGLLWAGARIIVALSGGRDSSCLLHALHRLDAWCVSALIVDHRLHPESNGHARSAAAFARSLGVEAAIVRAELRQAPGGMGPEAAARFARYQLFAEHATARRADFVLTAHTADDQAETLLMRLGQGTGLRGLAGIPRRRGLFVRPWLDVSRQEVEAYAVAHDVPSTEDPTNRDRRYLRNGVRLDVLPGMAASVGGAWTRRAALTARHAAQASALQDWLIARSPTLLRAVGDRIEVDGPALDDMPPPARSALLDTALRQALIRWAPGHARARALHVDRVMDLHIGQRCGLPGGLVARRVRTALTIGPDLRPPRPADAIVVGGPGSYEWGPWTFRVAVGRRAVDEGTAVVAVDAAPLPWSIRCARPAERMLPRGAPGHKALRRLWSEAGIPIGWRSALPVIDCGGRIIWAAGVRAAEHVRVAPHAPAWIVTVHPPAGAPPAAARRSEERSGNE